jgi:ribosomal protein L24E
MKTIKFFLFFPVLFFSSCFNQPKPSSTLGTVNHSDYYSIKDISKPEHVCDFSDGRKLFRIELGYGKDWVTNSHFVYFFNSSKEISINFQERVGKTTVNKTVVQLP